MAAAVFGQGRAMALFRCIVAGVGMLAVALSNLGAKAENEAPSLEVTPTSIEGRTLSTSEPIYVLVRLKSGAEELSEISLSSFSNDSITASFEGQDPAGSVAKLSASSEYVWKLRVAPSKDGALAPANRIVNFTAAFHQGKKPQTLHYLFKDLKITPPPDSGAPSLDVEPATIEGRTVSLAEPIEVEVRLKAGDCDLTDIKLSSFSNDGIVSTIVGGAPDSVSRLAANAEHAWRLRLAPAEGGALAPAAISTNVIAAFTEARDEPRQRYLFKDIKISAPPTVTVPVLVDIEIKGSLDALSHERPGRLYVIATNKHSRAVQVAIPQVFGPKFVEFAGPAAGATAAVAYGDAKVFAYDVTATDQVVPGKYPIMVAVSVTAPEGLSGSLVKSQDVEVAVLGESELLTKVGAPSILFLPGLLFLLAWQLLWSVGKPKAERDAYEMTPTSGGFWVVAVTISLVCAFVYPFAILAVLRQNRDYLTGYGLKDFLYLFAMTLGSACVLFVFWLSLRWVAARVRELIAWWTVPATGEVPQETLRKLGWVGASILCKLAHPAAPPANATQRVFILEPWREPAFLWIAPALQVLETDNAPPEALNFLQQVRTGQITSAWTIYGWVKKGLKKGWWTLQWEPVGTLGGPRKDSTNDWPEAAGEQRRLIM